jgi:hypothetical protein
MDVKETAESKNNKEDDTSSSEDDLEPPSPGYERGLYSQIVKIFIKNPYGQRKRSYEQLYGNFGYADI